MRAAQWRINSTSGLKFPEYSAQLLHFAACRARSLETYAGQYSKCYLTKSIVKQVVSCLKRCIHRFTAASFNISLGRKFTFRACMPNTKGFNYKVWPSTIFLGIWVETWRCSMANMNVLLADSLWKPNKTVLIFRRLYPKPYTLNLYRNGLTVNQKKSTLSDMFPTCGLVPLTLDHRNGL